MPVQAGITSSSAAEGYPCDAKRLDSRIALTTRAYGDFVGGTERDAVEAAQPWRIAGAGDPPATRHIVVIGASSMTARNPPTRRKPARS